MRLALSGGQEEVTNCPKCGGERTPRRRKPKLLSYLLFVGSFVAFLFVPSLTELSKPVNLLWITLQVALGLWVMRDRLVAAKPIFYCRTCDTRLR